MELTLAQQNAIARLYENESLTENLDDQSARALLEWAQGQIVANIADALVRAAVSAANSSGEQGVQALVATASTFLAQEIEARDAATAQADAPPAPVSNGEGASRGAATVQGDAPPALISSDVDAAPAAAARSNESAAAMTMGDVPAIGLAESVPDELTGRAATDKPAQFVASGAAAEQNIPTTPSFGNIGAANPSTPPPSKPRRKKSRKSKSPKKK